MADTIRSDVVEISFEVDDNPFAEINVALEDVVGAIRELTSVARAGFLGLGVAASDFGGDIQALANEMNSLGACDGLQLTQAQLEAGAKEYQNLLAAAKRYNNELDAAKSNPLGETANEAQKAARGISNMARELAQAAGAKIQAIPNAIKSSATAARTFASSLKAVAFDKITTGAEKLKSGFQQLKGMSIKDIAKGLDVGLGKAANKAVDLGRGLANALAQKGTAALKSLPDILGKGVVKAKELGAALANAAANGAKQLGGAMARGFGTTVKGVATGVMAASIAVGGLAVAGINAGIAYESAFAGVQKTVSMTESEAAVMSDAIRDMSLRLPTSAVEIAGVAEAAGQLGIAKEDIAGFSETMVMLGDTTNLAASEAATVFARFANVTGMDPGMNAENYSRMGSSVVALGNSFATTEAEIANMAQNLASAGTQVGMSQADILGISTALSSVGMEAEAGGTAMSKFLVEMQLATETGGGKLQEIASIAGMSGTEFQKAFKDDAAGALTSFLGGLGNLDAAGPSAIALLDEMGVSETRLRDALLRGANASDMFGEAIETSNAAWAENTALGTEATQRYSTMESQLGMLKNAATDLGIEFYQGVNTPMAAVVGTAKDMVGQLKEAFVSGGIEGFAAELGNVLGQVVTNIAGALPSIVNSGVQIIQNLVQGIVQNIPAITSGATTAVTSFVLGILQILPAVIDGALQLVTALVQGIVQNAPAIANGAAQAVSSFLMGVLQMLPVIIMGALQLVMQFLQGLLQNLPMIMQAGMQAINQIILGIAQMLPTLLVMAVQILLAILDGIVQNLPMLISAALMLITALIQGLGMAIPMLIDGAIQLVIGLVTGLIENLPLLVAGAVQMVIALVVGLIQAIPALVAAVPQLVMAIIDVILNTNWLEVGWEIIKGIGGGLLDGAKNLFGDLFGGGAEIETPTIAADTASAAATGQQMGTSLAGGFDEMANLTLPPFDPTAMTAGLTTAQPAIDTFSTSMDTVGAGATAFSSDMTTAATGVTSMGTSAVQMGTDMAALDTATATAATNMGTTLDTLGLKMTETQMAMSAELTTITTNAQTMANDITVVFTPLAETLLMLGVNAMQGFNNGLESQRSAVVGTAQSIANEVANTMRGALDIHSPSRVVQEIGVQTSEALPIGMESQLPAVRGMANQLAMAAQPPMHQTAGGTTLRPRSAENSPASTQSGNAYTSNSYAPQFNLTIGGGATATDRETERQVRAWIREEFGKMLRMAGSGAPAAREV